MIGWLQGKIIDKEHPGKMVLDVNGVGYDIETSLPTFFEVESREGLLDLHIHTIVREDALLLYGFADKQERALFRALLKVNGIGPKVALSILSSITPLEFIQCVHQNNTLQLTHIPGIGKKTAERLVMEMKDNLSHLANVESFHLFTSKSAGGLHHDQQEAISALEALGYKNQDAVKVIKKIDDGTKNCEQLIRQALQLLAVRA
ncbi:Holliday junction branch migration protein RuvA [Legionella taurinensis]|uniref:Holliday junction branch migration complex subunit RuvA n=1 Tax=Legionella taurinensis TaxID=70611 RepID=A0A3A5L3C3_9GAMM|nr:Holliday junction branch migration protein RuvA [Legionella taurinensis]MDX1837114.1 Holliday junction branch migration protein RuvA [Legionella taurinensis]PUT40403.1 Holliday junction branch migration protein RuvA [Legionella taurinensis]PUT40506.1 Holliday junction branch migration protein RuvA [Legionella taurinensis]PUT42751.1 Holliday junction branch migration protein RuvA [Legionella taurinensis]PUT48464.1 Holliday junction branch migration protein RuvA [Legionella taurinensis]